MTIRCEIATQENQIFSGDVDMVILPGSAGEMGILPHHAPVLTTLEFGVIRVRQQEKEFVFAVGGGFAEIQPDQVTILADSAEDLDSIDIEKELQARRQAEVSLEEAMRTPQKEYILEQAALRRLNMKINAVRKYRPKKSGGL